MHAGTICYTGDILNPELGHPKVNRQTPIPWLYILLSLPTLATRV